MLIYLWVNIEYGKWAKLGQSSEILYFSSNFDIFNALNSLNLLFKSL